MAKRKTGRMKSKRSKASKKRTASTRKKESTLRAIDEIMKEEGIPKGGARFENSKGKRVSKAGLVDSQGRMKTGRIVPREGAGGGEAVVIGFSGGEFH